MKPDCTSSRTVGDLPLLFRPMLHRYYQALLRQGVIAPAKQCQEIIDTSPIIKSGSLTLHSGSALIRKTKTRSSERIHVYLDTEHHISEANVVQKLAIA